MKPDFEGRLKATLSARQAQSLSVDGAREAAVLLPVVAGPKPALLLTLRTETVASHKGQISFPGGGIEPTDPSPEAAALREAEEELGLKPANVRLLGRLDAINTFVSGYVITPIVGWIVGNPALSPNPAEVSKVLEIPIDALNDDIRAEPGFSRRGHTFPTEAWVWNDHVIWGVTARIIRLFLYRLADASLGSSPGETSAPWGGASPSAQTDGLGRSAKAKPDAAGRNAGSKRDGLGRSAEARG